MTLQEKYVCYVAKLLKARPQTIDTITQTILHKAKTKCSKSITEKVRRHVIQTLKTLKKTNPKFKKLITHVYFIEP